MEEGRARVATSGPRVPNTSINFVQGNPDGGDDVVINRIWYQIPHEGQMIWLEDEKDGGTVVVKGIVAQVHWYDDVVEVIVKR